ncbi:uncharacterized protein EI97DRAFT_437319 [Westerdykella ornata]|uniref:U6 small nuclear RNA (adenine-(43)-N(6))-methyltransferase n=1 Tax=Westerdykella ornata TaxID=318751 RepID=A0A6A6J737_WESOR|nr:uncharacterized protein EI97DRAFT_437319 [Westerdykella ornata]KAF2272044.1 hypothetical protein EI97DRAFT_437319 [Westerdykella ornata]
METQPIRQTPYDKIDFKALSKKDSNFKQIFHKSSGHLNFQDPETCKTLTKALLKTDFNLELDIPDDRLCPPVPNRWNYVTWIQALIDSTSPDYKAGYDPERKVVGLDIGTGASAIYTLLILRTRPNWHMCVTDVDKKSFDFAARNLALNNMITRTTMLQTTDSISLIPLQYLGVEKLDFTICNPPFFSDEKEMRASMKGENKNWKPNAVCTGSEKEMVCSGGDLGFVTKIVEESLVLREKVTWYSSMLGKLSSTKHVVELLKKNGVTNWAVGCLEPGSVTKRWMVAWSFGDMRPPNHLARFDGIAHEYLPFPTRYKIPLPEDSDMTKASETINAQLSTLDLYWTWDSTTRTGIGRSSQNVWNRAYRREQQRKRKAGEADMHDTNAELKVALALRIRVSEGSSKEILIDWLQGADVQLWESFCGMVHRLFKTAKEQAGKSLEGGVEGGGSEPFVPRARKERF